ncbi:NAD(P)-dependent oxidoreductase [Marinomonas sp.]|uniref:NAD(P)-dependent oxidoreductase n=1 Tax=Marinomonas sp. TaxID=1904862 RepID=UPI003A904407
MVILGVLLPELELGNKASGICEKIQKAGYQLTVYNRMISKAQPFQERGATVANSIKELVERSDIIFTSLLDDNSIIELCLDEDGILDSMTTGKIHVGLTTIQPSTADHLKSEHEKRGCQYIAAPVVGRPDAAAAGKLITFLAGKTSAIEVAQPIIESYTAKQIPVGTVASSANGMKICVNYMAMAQLAMLGEVFTFAEKVS